MTVQEAHETGFEDGLEGRPYRRSWYPDIRSDAGLGQAYINGFREGRAAQQAPEVPLTPEEIQSVVDYVVREDMLVHRDPGDET